MIDNKMLAEIEKLIQKGKFVSRDDLTFRYLQETVAEVRRLREEHSKRCGEFIAMIDRVLGHTHWTYEERHGIELAQKWFRERFGNE